MKENWKTVTSEDGEVFYLELSKKQVWAESNDGTLKQLGATTDAFLKFRTDLTKIEDSQPPNRDS